MKRFIHNIIKSKIFRELNIFVKHFPQKNLYMEDMNFLNDILFELSIVVKDELEKENLKINSLTDYLIRKNNNSYNFVLEKYFSDAACEQINHSYAQKFSHREVSILLFSSFLIDTYDERAITLDYILEFEDPILLQPTKYNMQKVDEVNFNQTHYVVNNSAYLYNIFVNKCAKGIPLAFTILNKILKNNKCSFYMRTNSNLLITNKEIISDYFQHEHYRGIKKFNDTISLDNRKNISVFIDDYGNKLLMVIKKNIEKGTEFWDVEIEEIPVIDNTEYPILTRFIHAQYFVSEKVFKHIDYTINQYSYEVYKDKYKDEHNGIPIDQYTEKKYHYKVWCIEEVDISIIDWQNLVLYSLSPTFSKLFLEVV